MSAPAWNDSMKRNAKAHGKVLYKVFIQGKHASQGSYGVAGACTQRDAMILAAVINTTGKRSEEQQAELEATLGLEETP